MDRCHQAPLPRMYVAMGRPMLFEFRYSEFSAPTVASAAPSEEQLVQHQEQRADEYSGEERHDDRRMEDLEDRLFRQNCEHQTRAGHEEAETVEHHLALGPPMRIRAATYPTPITMPMTQKPSIAFNRPGIFPSFSVCWHTPYCHTHVFREVLSHNVGETRLASHGSTACCASRACSRRRRGVRPSHSGPAAGSDGTCCR